MYEWVLLLYNFLVYGLKYYFCLNYTAVSSIYLILIVRSFYF